LENFDIYKDIAERTQGDIYVGVVGPVRTGKSTFIKRFMDLMVIPNIQNVHKAERAKDELPQSASGKMIHTTEPKFVPNEAIDISIANEIKLKVRMVDCVGYIVKNALGYLEGSKPKMVHTPWYDYEIPFEEAAEIGTKKVINEHSTIGVLMTTDGSVTGIQRDEYLEAEERVVNELKAINKPFIIILNSREPDTAETQDLRKEMEAMYNIPVQAMDVMNMGEAQIKDIFEKILKEFPIKEISINIPEWIDMLEPDNWMKIKFVNIVKGMAGDILKVRDVRSHLQNANAMESDIMEEFVVDEINMGEGTAVVDIKPKKGLFYNLLGDMTGHEIKCDYDLFTLLKDFHKAKVKYDKVAEALKSAEETGYGMVPPQLCEMKLENPEQYRQGNRFGVKLKASAPSLHMIKADIQTEIAPLIGSEKESEDMLKSMLEKIDDEPDTIWKSNMFGKSLEVLVKEGLQKKLFKMPEDVQFKIQKTLEKIINEGNGGLICIIL